MRERNATRIRRPESVFGLAGIFLRRLWSEFTEIDDPYIEKWEGSSRYGRVAHFRVSQAFKGVSAASAWVHTGFGDGDCG